MRSALLALVMISLTSCGDDDPGEPQFSPVEDYIAGAESEAAATGLQPADNSPEARYLLGKAYLERDENQAAAEELLQAQEMGWHADDIRPELAKALLAQGKTANVLAMQFDDLSLSSAAKLLSVQAIAALEEGQSDDAVTLVAQARASDPDSLDAILAEARLLSLRENTVGAINLIDQVLEKAPEYAQAWRLKAQIRWRQQKLEEARAAFSQSIAYSTAPFADHLSRALLNTQLRDFAGVEADVALLAEISPKHPGRDYLQGLLYFNDGQYRNAITVLSRAESAARKYPRLLYYLSLAHLLDGNLDLGAKLAREFVDLAPGDIHGRKLLAAARFQQHKFGDIQGVLQPVLDFNPNDVGALNITANTMLLDGQADAGLLRFAHIARLVPGAPLAGMSFSTGLLISGLGLGSEASPQLAAILDPRPEFPLKDILLILERILEKEFEQAIEAADSYKWRAPNDLAPYNILGNIYLAADQPARAQEVFHNALKREPGNVFANLNLAKMARHTGDSVAERQHYKTVLKHHPDNLPALLLLAVLEGKENNDADMVVMLRAAIDENPTALQPRLSLARYYLDSGSPRMVPPLFRRLNPLQQRAPRVLELFALSHLALQNYESAYLALEQLANTYPASVKYRYMQWQAASGAGNSELAREALERALRLDPSHLPSLLAMADIALAENEQELFQQHLATLVTLSPEDPGVLRLRSSAARMQGNLPEAMAFSRRAFAGAPDTATFLELTENRIAAGQGKAARTAMLRWIKERPSDVAVRLALGDNLLMENDLRGAQNQYKEVLKLEPDNVLALNNLAWKLRRQKPALALEYIRKADSLSPGEPGILDTMAVVEHFNGKNALASVTIGRALAAEPGNLSMRYHQAMIVAALDKTAPAIALLEALLGSEGGEFPERAEAEDLLVALKG